MKFQGNKYSYTVEFFQNFPGKRELHTSRETCFFQNTFMKLEDTDKK
jgi:hypothetical protein